MLGAAAVPACGAAKEQGFGDLDAGAGAGGGGGSAGGGADGSPPVFGGGGNGVPPATDADPATCAEAAQARSYVGCDYWPTVLANAVDNVFDFAVVVANVGTHAADVVVTGPNGVNQKVAVAPGELSKIYLPWVAPLKGTKTGGGDTILASVLARKSAYHLVSTAPVIVYQFNPLEFKGTGGPPGKSWASCPTGSVLNPQDCYSYSNDASLLLPSTAMTGNYRVFGETGWSAHPAGLFGPDTTKPLQDQEPTYFAVTATQDGTTVHVKLAGAGLVKASSGGEIAATPGGGTLTFTLDQGDVAEVVSEKGIKYDFSGSLLSADKPVQVISGVPCIYLPLDKQACDHVEETIFPAETLGQHYVVTVPTSPKGNIVGHIVRFYGNVDGTKLTYVPSAPPGCPATIDAGQMAECTGTVARDFEVRGDHEFAVGSFMLAGELVDTSGGGLTLPSGDPSQTFSVAVEQYRKSYLFLAPDDYTASFVDVVGPAGASVTLDGAPVPASSFTPIGGGYGVARLALSAGKGGGAHTMKADQPVGIQVIGYGANTSYQYPGGLNLGRIAPPPVK